jgi:SAM-dependent methyltransferase
MTIDSNYTCIVCGNKLVVLYDFSSYRWYICPSCRFACSSLMLEDKLPDYSDWYGERYFAENPAYFSRLGKEDATRLKLWNKYLGWMDKNIRQGGNGKLLDVGSNLGAFLSLAGKRNWLTSGVDVSEYAVRYSRDNLGLNVFQGDLESAAFPAEHFDCVSMWDVIEHLPNPLQTLKEAGRVTRKGGLVIIYTPNQDSLLNRLIEAFYGLIPGRMSAVAQKVYPSHRHLCYFTPHSLALALAASGFKVIKHAGAPLHAYSSPVSTLIERMAASAIDIIGRLINLPYRMLLVGQRI